MKKKVSFLWSTIGLASFFLGTACGTLEASPSAADALKLVPTQKGVDYETPSEKEAKDCQISAPKIDGKIGWIVENPAGLLLRRFLDTNGDNKVDQWCYYKDGVEVYRDIDSNFDKKADQFRWFNTGGCRFGIDADQDGQIDAWKTISAEEVTSEAVAAWAENDLPRFECLLPSKAEIEKLGLGEKAQKRLAEAIAQAKTEFQKTAATQKVLTPKSKWIQFGGSKPGIVPEGTGGSTKDLRVYENVTAIVETDGKTGEIQIGTLVQIGDTWRLIRAPQLTSNSEMLAGGFFFQPESLNRANLPGSAGADGNQDHLAELEKIDAQLQKATSPEAQAKLNARRAELFEKMADAATTPEDRALWLRQSIDMVNAAVLGGTFSDGTKHLKQLYEKLKKNPKDRDLAAYARFRQLSAEYAESFKAPKPDYQKIQNDWIENLTQFVKEYPDSPDTAEAMLQLAMSQEFAGEEKESIRWYGQIVKDFPKSPVAQKADGAKRRLESVGKPIPLRAKAINGKTVDLSKFRGRTVVIQYWASWSDPAKADMATLKELLSKYGSKLGVIGVNLDVDRGQMESFLKENRLPWHQVFEKGGLDSRLANELGIMTVPTMILIDSKGRVVRRNVEVAELDGELKKLIR